MGSTLILVVSSVTLPKFVEFVAREELGAQNVYTPFIVHTAIPAA